MLRLTSGQKKIISEINSGKRVKQIAADFNRDVSTIQTQLCRARDANGCKTVDQLYIKYGMELNGKS